MRLVESHLPAGGVQAKRVRIVHEEIHLENDLKLEGGVEELTQEQMPDCCDWIP